MDTDDPDTTNAEPRSARIQAAIAAYHAAAQQHALAAHPGAELASVEAIRQLQHARDAYHITIGEFRERYAFLDRQTGVRCTRCGYRPAVGVAGSAIVCGLCAHTDLKRRSNDATPSQREWGA